MAIEGVGKGIEDGSEGMKVVLALMARCVPASKRKQYLFLFADFS